MQEARLVAVLSSTMTRCDVLDRALACPRPQATYTVKSGASSSSIAMPRCARCVPHRAPPLRQEARRNAQGLAVCLPLRNKDAALCLRGPAGTQRKVANLCLSRAADLRCVARAYTGASQNQVPSV